MEHFGWRPYVSVAARKHAAARRLADLKKKGRSLAPVTVDGRTIAACFWGKSWCDNLERYSDYATRLPRGRSYVRNGCVIDLQIAKGQVVAMVSGSELYDVTITISPVVATRWKAICRDCTGAIDSLVELLQGRLAKGVMDRVCREGDGLFPAPHEIKLRCSCPDWADMCKHVAAVLYGVGARLDREPQLLFVLRGVEVGELIAGAGEDLAKPKLSPPEGSILAQDDVAALFGLDMVDGAASNSAAAAPASTEPAARENARKRKVVMKAKKSSTPRKVKRKRKSAGKAAPAGLRVPTATQQRGDADRIADIPPDTAMPTWRGTAPTSARKAQAAQDVSSDRYGLRDRARGRDLGRSRRRRGADEAG